MKNLRLKWNLLGNTSHAISTWKYKQLFRNLFNTLLQITFRNFFNDSNSWVVNCACQQEETFFKDDFNWGADWWMPQFYIHDRLLPRFTNAMIFFSIHIFSRDGDRSLFQLAFTMTLLIVYSSIDISIFY